MAVATVIAMVGLLAGCGSDGSGPETTIPPTEPDSAPGVTGSESSITTSSTTTSTTIDEATEDRLAEAVVGPGDLADAMTTPLGRTIDDDPAASWFGCVDPLGTGTATRARLAGEPFRMTAAGESDPGGPRAARIRVRSWARVLAQKVDARELGDAFAEDAFRACVVTETRRGFAGSDIDLVDDDTDEIDVGADGSTVPGVSITVELTVTPPDGERLDVTRTLVMLIDGDLIATIDAVAEGEGEDPEKVVSELSEVVAARL